MYLDEKSNSLYNNLGPIPNLYSLSISSYLFFNSFISASNSSLLQSTASVLIINPVEPSPTLLTIFFNLNLSFSSTILFDIVILSFEGI